MIKKNYINEANNNDNYFLSAIKVGFYNVDAEKGIIKSNKRKNKIVGKYKHPSGYFVLHLPLTITNGIDRFIRTHRAIWISKFGIPPNGFVVGHKNNIKTDCRIENLYLTTIRGNLEDAKRDGLFLVGEKVSNSVLTEEIVRNIKSIYKKNSKTLGMRALAKKYDVHLKTICDIFSKRTWSHIQ